MFCEAFWSRSCSVPHVSQTQSLIPSSATPFGPALLPQNEQVRVVLASLTSRKMPQRPMSLWLSTALRSDHPRSSTDLAMFVFANFDEDTSPTAIGP